MNQRHHQWYLYRYGYPIKQLGGRYTLLHPLGRGGMGDVCLAWDEQNSRMVAAKVMLPVLDPRRPRRFLREGVIAVSLHHQHVIHVYDYGDRVQTERGDAPDSVGRDELVIPYIIMEYIKEGNLEEWLAKRWLEPERTFSLDEILGIFEQLCTAVQYIHSKGLIHRDIKPANILFRELPQKGGQIEVVLSDFGLTVGDYDTLSQPKAGTMVYTAPEQRQGDPQKASDIFSLGVLLYQLCTGHLPFQMTDLELPQQEPSRPIWLNPSLSPALDSVILRALSDDPAQRFESASLFWQAVQNAVRQTPSPQISWPQTNPLSNRETLTTLSSGFQRSVFSSAGNLSAVRSERPRVPAGISTLERDRLVIIIIAVVIITLCLSGDRADLTAPATITITPTSKTVQDTYLMQGVTSNANADKLQIAVRQLNSTKTNTTQVTATGRVHQGEQSASGDITFFNSSHNKTFEVSTGTTFQVGDVQIITDETVVVPVATKGDTAFQYPVQDEMAVVPAASSWQPGQITVPAHAVQGGQQETSRH